MQRQQSEGRGRCRYGRGRWHTTERGGGVTIVEGGWRHGSWLGEVTARLRLVEREIEEEDKGDAVDSMLAK